MKFFIKTFGCRVNQVESESIREALVNYGFRYDGEHFDIVIINSCCVTDKAEKEVLRYIRRCVLNNTIKKIIVTGCLASAFKEKIKEIKNEIQIFPNNLKSEIVYYLTGNRMDDFFKISGFLSKTRAFIKIQDGCNLRCSYCIVPIARENMISKPFNNVMDEIKELVFKKYREIVLCGTRLGAYNYDGKRLEDLLEAIYKLPGNFRVRLSSIEPMEINERLVEITSDTFRFCSYFHIPLQSGSDRILKLMRRPYTTDYYRKKVELIRKKMKDPGIYSDIIVGFPSETDEDFKNSLNFVEEISLSGLHIFTYSKREKTESFGLDDVPSVIRKERSMVMHMLDEKLRNNFALSMKGKTLDCIVLRKKNDLTSALTTNFIEVILKDNVELNSRVNLKITDVIEKKVYASL